MALYLLNKQELMVEGFEIVSYLMGEMMYCELRTKEEWVTHYANAVNEIGAKDFMEYIEMVAKDLVAVAEEVEEVKDDGTLYNLVLSVLINEAMKLAKNKALAVA